MQITNTEDPALERCGCSQQCNQGRSCDCAIDDADIALTLHDVCSMIMLAVFSILAVAFIAAVSGYVFGWWLT